MRFHGFLILIFIFIITLSAVSAADSNTNSSEVISFDDTSVANINNTENDILSLGNENIYEKGISVVYVNQNSGSDLLNDGSSQDKAFKTLPVAINAVSSGGTIYLSDGIYTRPQFSIGKSLSIIGSNSTIFDGGNTVLNNPCFKITSGSNFLFKNLKFVNVKASNKNNGNIFQLQSINSVVTIENCDFINTSQKVNEHLFDHNYDDGGGYRNGAPVIYIGNKVTANILNCNFINDYLTYKGEEFSLKNGGNDWIVRNYGNLTIMESRFVNSTDGFICNDETAISLNISKCTFINGSSFLDGGAIKSYAPLSVNNSSFIDCGFNNFINGGAIFLSKGSNSKSVTNIINNTCFEKCGVTGDYLGFGGAIFIDKNTKVILNNDTFSQCSGKGAAIYNMGNTIMINSSLRNMIITPTTNMYYYYLGSVYNDLGSMEIIGSIFENNTCQRIKNFVPVGSPCIYNKASLEVSYSIFAGNHANDKRLYECVYTENSIKSLDFNFWGCDENPADNNLTNFKNINYWFYIDTPEYLALNINDTANITANLRLNDLNKEYDSNKINTPLIVFSSDVNGESLYMIKNFENKTASILFDLTKVKGQYSLLTGLYSYSKPTIIDVGKNVSIMNIDIKDVLYGETLKVNVSVENSNSEFLNGNVSFNLNKNISHMNLTNGYCSFEISNLNPGNYTLKVTYEGDENYFKSIKYVNFKVNKIPTNLSISIPEIFNVGQKVKLNTTLNPENFKIRAYLYINGNRTNVLYIYGGNTNISLGVRPVGEYNITIELFNHTFYESSSARASFTVERYDVNLTLDVNDIQYGQNATITINSSPENFTGKAILEINGQNQSIFIYNTQTIVNLSNLNPGRYDIKLFYLGDDKFENVTVTGSFNVFKSNVTLDINVEEGFILVKTDYMNCTGSVSLFINERFYSQNLSGGVCNFTADFDKGYNYIYAYYLGDEHYEYATVNTTYFVPDTPGLTGENLIIYEHSGEGYVINLNNELGYPIVNATISIEVGNKKYDVKTNFEGYASLPLNLDVGDYLLLASYKKFNVSNNISVKPINLRLSLNKSIYQDQIQIITASVSKGVIGQICFEFSQDERYIADIDDGRATLSLSNLTVGNHTIIAYYFNGIYNSSSISADFTVVKYDADMRITFNDTLYGNDVIFNVTLPEDVKGNVSFLINGNIFVEDVIEGNAVFNLSNLDVGLYNFTVFYSGDDYYSSKMISDNIFKVFKLKSNMNVIVEDVLAGDDVVIQVFMDKGASGSITFSVNGTDYIRDVDDGRVVLVLSNLKVNTYDLIVNYSGDNHYYPDSATAEFSIKIKFSDIDVEVNDTSYLKNILIKANVTKGATGNVMFKIDNITKSVEIINSTAIWELSGLSAGNYHVIAKYGGDDEYVSSQSEKSFNVNKAQSEINITVNSFVPGENIRIYAVVNPNMTGNITFRMLGYYSPRNKTINGNNASWLITPLKSGQYTIIASYAGNENYLPSNTTYYLSINQIETKLNVIINNVSKTSDVIVKATLKTVNDENIDGQIMLTVGEYDYIMDITDGKGLINISKLSPGVYNYSALYSGSKTYARSAFEASFIIEDTFKDVKLIANPLIKYYSGDERLTVYLTDDNYNPISNACLYINIGGVEYERTTDDKGTSSMAINLNSGNYTVNIRFEGFGVYNSASLNLNITVNPTVEALDVTKIFKNDTQYYAIFCDSQGNLLKDTTVKFNINGIIYTRTTNEYGIAGFNINLNHGNYILTAENTVTGEFKSNLITVLPSIIENHDIDMFYRNGTNYTVKLIGSDGKAIANEKVIFNINGVLYARTSNDEGYAYLNINLNPGNYIITAEYDGCKVSNNIAVKSVLLSNDLSFRRGYTSSFEVTLLDGHGRLYSNQTITFNINGVLYNRTTNDGGIASLNIRLQAGKYIITSSYNGCNAANTITIY